MSIDPLHPTGKCTCAGEGKCAWCWEGEAARLLAVLAQIEKAAIGCTGNVPLDCPDAYPKNREEWCPWHLARAAQEESP